jgi:LysM repeat protein
MFPRNRKLARFDFGVTALSIGLVFIVSGFACAQSVPVGNYVGPGKVNSDVTFHPTVARRSLHDTEATELPVGSILYSGDTLYIRWMEAKLRLCPDGDKIYGRVDKDETPVPIADCFEKNDEVPSPDAINLYIRTSWSPLSFGAAHAAVNAVKQTQVGYPPHPDARSHRLSLINSDDSLSDIAAMFGVSVEALQAQNGGGGDWGYKDGDLITIPVVPHRLNWPIVARLNPDRKDALEFQNVRGAAVWSTGTGVIAVSKEADRLIVTVDHQNGFVSKILGLTNLQKQPGTTVDANELLGEVAGDDLEFEVLKDGEKINPLELLAVQSDPAKPDIVPK